MKDLSVSAELPHVRRACYVVALVAATVTLLFAGVLVAAAVMDRSQPLFVVELAISLGAVIYFGNVTKQAVRAANSSGDEDGLPQALHYLSRSVIGLLVPLSVLVVAAMWFLFRSPY